MRLWQREALWPLLSPGWPDQPAGEASTAHRHLLGISNRKCFFGAARNCCAKVSGDHFISRTVLKVLTESQIKISGPNVSRIHALNSSSPKTKRLCKRHNTALLLVDDQRSVLSALSHIFEYAG